ncbi:DUF7667 family protein [Paenibacillus sp. strain BS8-2]
MVGIHPVHRRMAELTLKARATGGYHMLSLLEKREFEHCMKVNFDLVSNLDSLKSVAFVAYTSGDAEWHQELCAKIEELESKLL